MRSRGFWAVGEGRTAQHNGAASVSEDWYLYGMRGDLRSRNKQGLPPAHEIFCLFDHMGCIASELAEKSAELS